MTALARLQPCPVAAGDQRRGSAVSQVSAAGGVTCNRCRLEPRPATGGAFFVSHTGPAAAVSGTLQDTSCSRIYKPLMELASPTGDADQPPKGAVFLAFSRRYRPALYHAPVPKATCMPGHLRFAIEGHAMSDVGDTYGCDGYPLKVLA